MKLKQAIIVGGIGLAIFACNPVRIVEPLKKGEKAIGANLGGAMVKLGKAPVVLPLSSIYGAYGITSKTTIHASFHVTSSLFGVLQTDVGITYGLLKPKVWLPGISVGMHTHAMVDIWTGTGRIYPTPEINIYRKWGKDKQHTIYSGFNTWVELQSMRAHKEPQPNIFLPSFQIGILLSTPRHQWQIECKQLAIGISNQNLVVDYISPFSYGATGIYLGWVKKF